MSLSERRLLKVGLARLSQVFSALAIFFISSLCLPIAQELILLCLTMEGKKRVNFINTFLLTAPENTGRVRKIIMVWDKYLQNFVYQN